MESEEKASCGDCRKVIEHNTRVITVRMKPSLHAKLSDFCHDLRRSQNQVCGRAIEEALAEVWVRCPHCTSFNLAADADADVVVCGQCERAFGVEKVERTLYVARPLPGA